MDAQSAQFDAAARYQRRAREMRVMAQRAWDLSSLRLAEDAKAARELLEVAAMSEVEDADPKPQPYLHCQGCIYAGSHSA